MAFIKILYDLGHIHTADFLPGCWRMGYFLKGYSVRLIRLPWVLLNAILSFVDVL